MTDRAAARQAAIDRFLSMLDHRRQGDSWLGLIPESYGSAVFGGIGLAVAARAACRDAPDGSRLHSLHAHFLRPVRAGVELSFRSEPIKSGRTFCVNRVTGCQDERPVLALTCSFTADTDGYVYDVSGIPEDVRPPAELPEPDEEGQEIGPWDVRWVGPSPPRPDGTREATHRHWFRMPRTLADDAHLHTALLAYATDWTGVGGRPLHLDGDITGMVSLDQAAWFHRPARVDDWLLQDVQALVNAGGRGTLRGVIRDLDGRIVASMGQEMLLRPLPG